MPKTDVVFLHEADHPCPFLLTLIEYTCDGKEGSILFEGFYRVNDVAGGSAGSYEHSLPQIMKLYVRRLEDIPTLILQGGHHDHIQQEYRTLDEHIYRVEVYKRILHTNYKHLNKMTLQFRVLNKESS